MKFYIGQLISEAIKQISPEESEAILSAATFDVSYPKPEFGDYASNAAMMLFKNFNVKPASNPAEFAKLIAKTAFEIDKNKTFSKIENAGGFINFTLANSYLLFNLNQILEQKNNFGLQEKKDGEKILLEYFQPNVAKPLHLGHLENGIFGDSLFKLLTATGKIVESDTHLGDWGTQFGLLLLAFKMWGDMSVIEQDPIVELNKLYVKINQEIESNPGLREQGKAEFVKLEQGDQQNYDLWQKFKEWSWQEYDFMYKEVGIRQADHDFPESFYIDLMPKVLDMLNSKGLLVQSEGAQIVNLEQFNLGIAVVVKSDGGTTYLLRDLATYIHRKEMGFAKQFYVVDVRQSHALAQTFKILQLLGVIDNNFEAKHIAYGFLKLPDGAMSTRKGTVIGAKELYEDARAASLKIVEQKNPDLEDKESVSKIIANAAIKYFILSRNLKNDIIFDKENSLSFEGNTGPYLQYTHARICGITRKVGIEASNINPSFDQINTSEQLVLRKLQQYQAVVNSAADNFLPNTLCSYLFELSQDFNNFYEHNSVVNADSEGSKQLRLAISVATAQVIKNGLDLLGITAPQQM